MKKWAIRLFILLPLVGCQDHDVSENKATPTKETPTTINYEAKGKLQQEKLKNYIMLDLPLIKQNPELKYGCEVTSTAMMLQYSGASVDKMELYKKIRKDDDPLVEKGEDIISWGDPDVGFVGDMTGKNKGYATFDKPIEDLVNQYTGGHAVNLTNKSFSQVISHLSKSYPVVVWTTGDYRLPNRWEAWEHEGETIKTPLDLHVVVLVGYDKDYVYVNDPLSGKKQEKINRTQFEQSWVALEKRAVSYTM